MALATKCPHCKTTFRVASDQLKLRGGIVRCGTCQQVFDGNASLVDMDAVARPVAIASVPVIEPVSDAVSGQAEQAAPVAIAEAADVPAALGEDPASEPDIDAACAAALEMAPDAEPDPEPEPEPEPDALHEHGPETTAAPAQDSLVLPAVLQPEPGYILDFDLSEPAPFTAVDFDLSDDAHHLDEPDAVQLATVEFDLGDDCLPGAPDAAGTELSVADEVAFSSDEIDVVDVVDAPDLSENTRAMPDLETGPLPLLRQSAAEPEPEPEPEPALETALPAELAPDPDEPEFVRLARDKELAARRRRLTMGGGSLLLAVALALQGAYVFRHLLAARYPGIKPALVAACKVAGCKIELPAQIESQSIEGPDLQALPNGNLVLTALLRNASSLPQAWPHIELELTDADRKPVIRRVFTPKQYLPASTLPGKGFAPGTEQPVKIQFELKQSKASGFNIGVFYP